MRAPRQSLAHQSLARFACWLGLCCALAGAGCANRRLPRIDPTGERLFVWGDPAAPPAGLAAAPPFVPSAGPFAPTAPVFTPPGTAIPGAPITALPLPGVPGLTVSPSQVIAPIGSEVVMIATVIADEGYPLTREKVEWMLNPEGPGQFVSPGVRRPWDLLNCLHRYPKKITPVYAINRTLASPMTIDRGTPTAADDISVQDGQAWVTVTSASEGTSHVTVFAPEVEGWDRRQQSATIYWVDAQWRFPSPGITPVGGRNTLTTTVSRQSDGTPLAGWVVRYEIAGGPAGAFAPSGANSVEIVTNAAGEAPAEIFQQQASPGTNQINIQVIRPASPGGEGRQLPVGTGTTLQTWTSGDSGTPYNPSPIFTPVPPPTQAPPATQTPPVLQEQPPVVLPSTPQSTTPVPQPQTPATVPAASPKLEITVTAPPLAVVGSDVQFEIQVANRGTVTATGLLVTDKFDEGLEHSSARDDRTIVRNLTDLQPGDTSRLAVTFHVGKAGQLCQEVTITANGMAPVSTRNCITANESPLGPEPQPLPTEPAPATPTGPTPAEPAPTPAIAELTVTKRGPARHSVGELALFEIVVTNRSQRTIENIEIADNYEISLEPHKATGGSTWLGNALGWKVSSLEPGGTVRREIQMRCLRETPRACNRVTVTATGMEAIADEACLEITAGAGAAPAPTTPITPAGASDISVAAVETADPIRVDGQTTYQVLLTNRGEGSAFDVDVDIQFGAELQLLQHSGGPVRGSLTADGVRFQTIRELRAGETQTFELRFKGVRAGTGKVHVSVTSRGLPTPITADQTTEVLSP